MTPLVLNAPDTGRLVVGRGERVALLGPSGCGKTRLLRRLLGLDRPGRRPWRQRDRSAADTVAWVPQGDGVFLDETVLDNVARLPLLPTVPVDEAVAWLDLLAMAEQVDVPVRSLPTPGRRRVALARALALHRPVLVIDGDLDATLGPLLPLVLAQAPHVEAVVTAGCLADDWAWNADTVALLEDGRVVAQAPLAALWSARDPAVKGVLAWVTP